MQSNNPNSSICKYCAENGFPNVCIYWDKKGEKEDGTPKWVPFKDQTCTVRHIHEHLEQRTAEEQSTYNAMVKSTMAASSRADLIGEQAGYPSDSEIKDALTTAFELSQKQSTLLKNLLDSLEYVPKDNS
jgi:hypothetical protein